MQKGGYLDNPPLDSLEAECNAPHRYEIRPDARQTMGALVDIDDESPTRRINGKGTIFADPDTATTTNAV